MSKQAADYTRNWLRENGQPPGMLSRWVTQWLPEEFYEPELHAIDKASSEDEKLVRQVKLIQKWVYGDPGDAAAGVPQQDATAEEMDGFLGTGTHRRMETWVAYVNDEDDDTEPSGGSYLLFNGEKLEVPGVWIIQPSDEHGLSFEKDYAKKKKKAKKKGEKAKRPFGRRKEPSAKGSTVVPSDVSLLGTIHWDVCLDAHTCFRILSKKGYSSVFGIDNPRPDGRVPVYQWLDFGRNFGYHGGSKANRASLLSFDLSNAVSLKYSARYLKKTGIARPIIDARPHGNKKKLLGMYKGQILSLLRILKVVSSRFPSLDFAFPSVSGKPVEAVYGLLFGGSYSGAHSHLHITTNKWDVSGLEAQVIYMMRKDSTIADEFPGIAELFDVGGEQWSEWEAKKDKVWTWAEVTG
jgi:hypothetical protein